MTLHLVKFAVLWINCVPNKAGVSNTLSPRTILAGVHPDCNRDCRIPFGAYAQVDEHTHPRNGTEQAQTTGAACLGPVGNLQGGHKFMNLSSDEKTV